MTEKKAPVFFTIAALRHGPIPAFGDTYWPRLHDELRKKGYSGNIQMDDASIQLHNNPGGVLQPEVKERSWTVFTPGREHAYSFSDSGIFSFHTSQYTTRQDLFAQFRAGLEVLHKHVELQTYTSVGVRMLDLVRPSDTEQEFSDYIQPSLLGFTALDHVRDWKYEATSLHQRYIDGDAEVVARFDCLPKSFGIQLELFQAVQGHALPEFLTSAHGRPHGILDIDSHTNGQQPKAFDVDAVMVSLAEHKNRISDTFYASTTPTAHAIWGLKS